MARKLDGGTGFGPHGHVQRPGGLRNNAQLEFVCVPSTYSGYLVLVKARRVGRL